jgi:uncharacterized protein
MPPALRRLPLLAIAVTVLLAVPGRAEGVDPADLAFWQSIENSADPAEYRAYLDAFPDGRFAPLARLRARGGAGAAAPARPAAAPDRDEIAFWASIENSQSPAEFQAYLDAYPHGRFAELARLRLAALGGGEAGEQAGSVSLETEDAGATAIGLVEDIAGLADDGARRGVLPVIGKGAAQNLADLYRQRAVDLAIVQADVLDDAKAQHRYPGMTGTLTYIAKLYNEELHLLARRGIKSIADLAHQKVSLGPQGAGAAVTAGRLFQLLKIPVETENDDTRAALDKLRQGEIAALAVVAAKPAGLFRGLDGKDGLHFLAVPINPAVTAAFVPTRLDAADYPGLIAPNQPVDAVAVGAVLAVANLTPGSARWDAVARFTDRFFTQFDTLLGPGRHQKWREVNLAAELPGWRRFPPAAEWLRRNQGVGAISPQALQAIFTRFIDERQQAAGGPPVPAQQKEDLFKEFQRWQSSQLR